MWFDALLNYVTALSYAREGEDLTERFWPAFHIIGKDILKFHAVYWPAFLMAAGYEVPKRMFIHGYLLMEGHKMSKSLGNVLDPFEVIERFGADALRYYCFREVSFGQDGSVSAAGFEARYESELANEYGNLASRTLAMIERYRDGVVPDAEPDPELVEGEDGLAGLEGRVRELLDRAELTQALEEIWVRVRRLNRYVEETRPWDLAKDDGAGRPARRRSSTASPRACGCWPCCCHAYMPETGGPAARRRSARTSGSWRAFGSRGGGQATEKLPPLFPKIETAAALAFPCGPTGLAPRLPRVVDTHAHLGVCEPADGELVAAARQVGVRRILTVGMDEASNREAIAAAEAHEEVFACVGRHPNSAAGFDEPAAARDRGAGGPRARGRDRRDRARLLPRPRPARRAAGGLRGPDRDRPPHRAAARDPHARPGGRRRRAGRDVRHARGGGRGGDGGPPLLLGRRRSGSPRRPSAAGTARSPATSPIPKADELREAARLVPEELLLVETDSPFLAPQPVRGKPNQPANVVEVAERLAAERGIGYEELERMVEANAARVFRW